MLFGRDGNQSFHSRVNAFSLEPLNVHRRERGKNSSSRYFDRLVQGAQFAWKIRQIARAAFPKQIAVKPGVNQGANYFITPDAQIDEGPTATIDPTSDPVSSLGTQFVSPSP